MKDSLTLPPLGNIRTPAAFVVRRGWTLVGLIVASLLGFGVIVDESINGVDRLRVIGSVQQQGHDSSQHDAEPLPVLRADLVAVRLGSGRLVVGDTVRMEVAASIGDRTVKDTLYGFLISSAVVRDSSKAEKLLLVALIQGTNAILLDPEFRKHALIEGILRHRRHTAFADRRLRFMAGLRIQGRIFIQKIRAARG